MQKNTEAAVTMPSDEQDESPADSPGRRSFDSSHETSQEKAQDKPGLLTRLRFLFTGKHEKTDEGLREAIEDYIVEPEGFNNDSVSTHERLLFSNILKLRDISVVDVMIPRADIVALDVDTPKDDLFKLLSEQQFSRFPVYSETLDDVLGTVHIKDIVGAIAKGQKISLKDMVIEIPIVSPAMTIPDLVLKMRHSRRHMALVVDEYGGIDGLVTIGDVIESIIGEIEDEHDTHVEPQMIEAKDGSVLADARVSLEEFENRYGALLDDEEREESDTLAGLVSDLAGRIPVRGEVITHSSGMVFEIMEADPRRVSSLKISHIPEENEAVEE
ncbi:MAG: hemolysin family protein [Alphaproteobacteria bacterium]